jgi:ubiquitin C-terminal hydrolase
VDITSTLLIDCLNKEVGPDSLKTTDLNASKETHILRPPVVLAMFFKRFKLKPLPNKSLSKQYTKNDDFVSFPLLDLDMSFGKQLQDFKYDCFGVIDHIGTMAQGHYVAKCRGDDGRWTLFDDANVTTIEDASVCTSRVIFPNFFLNNCLLTLSDAFIGLHGFLLQA